MFRKERVRKEKKRKKVVYSIGRRDCLFTSVKYINWKHGKRKECVEELSGNKWDVKEENMIHRNSYTSL